MGFQGARQSKLLRWKARGSSSGRVSAGDHAIRGDQRRGRTAHAAGARPFARRRLESEARGERVTLHGLRTESGGGGLAGRPAQVRRRRFSERTGRTGEGGLDPDLLPERWGSLK